MQRSEPWLGQRTHRLYVQVARTACEVRAAQRLRYEVFATEMGARLNGPDAGVDEDRFDAHCDHLLVREAGSGDVVGTYRILGPRAAENAGGRRGHPQPARHRAEDPSSTQPPTFHLCQSEESPHVHRQDVLAAVVVVPRFAARLLRR